VRRKQLKEKKKKKKSKGEGGTTAFFQKGGNGRQNQKIINKVAVRTAAGKKLKSGRKGVFLNWGQYGNGGEKKQKGRKGLARWGQVRLRSRGKGGGKMP